MKDNKLITVTPESVGIPSKAIRDYIEALIDRKVNLHSFLVLKNGKICAEGYCPPYKEDKLQRLYSISKTFTSMAIGLLADEGKICLDDQVISYFPEYLPEKIHPWLADLKIRDLLRMSSVFSELNHAPESGPWVKAYLNGPVTHPSGSIFMYDTAASHTLCVLVEKISGMTMLEYMRKRFLDPIGFSEDAWCVKGTDGFSWGGSGVMATLRDLAKFACTVMNGGRFDGKQLLPEAYVKAATTRQIYNDRNKDGSRLSEGYGYQVWMLPEGAFAFWGMGSQCAICFPKFDLIFCCTADNQGADVKEKLIFEEIYHRLIPFISDQPVTENEKEYDKLLKMCKEIRLSVVEGKTNSAVKEKVNDTVYVMEENPMKWSEICLSFNGDEGVLRYKTPRGSKEIYFGLGKHVEYAFPETHYYYEQIGLPSGKGYRAWSSAAWVDENTLVIRTETLDEYLGNMTMTISFKDDDVGIAILKSAEYFFDEYQGMAGGRKKNLLDENRKEIL